jgi:hypothetical protein
MGRKGHQEPVGAPWAASSRAGGKFRRGTRRAFPNVRLGSVADGLHVRLVPEADMRACLPKPHSLLKSLGQGVSKHGLEKCCRVANATAPIKRRGQSLSQAQDGLEPRNSKGDLTMKTLLAIALAAAALTIGTATVAPISSTAVAGGGGPDKWCGAAVCPPKQAPSGTHLGQ